jgi:hypothetical protein
MPDAIVGESRCGSLTGQRPNPKPTPDNEGPSTPRLRSPAWHTSHCVPRYRFKAHATPRMSGSALALIAQKSIRAPPGVPVIGESILVAPLVVSRLPARSEHERDRGACSGLRDGGDLEPVTLVEGHRARVGGFQERWNMIRVDPRQTMR